MGSQRIATDQTTTAIMYSITSIVAVAILLVNVGAAPGHGHYRKAAPAPTKTIAELAIATPQLSTLLAAVKAADLVETLSGEGPFTVFAPTNDAFNKVPEEALTGLLANKEALKAVLLRHVVPSAIQGKNIPPGTTALTTAGGEKIDVTRDEKNLIQIQSAAGSAYVVLFDVVASNGVVHAVDSVF